MFNLKIALLSLLSFGAGDSIAQQANPLKVLFVVTSHGELGNTGEKTGLWIEEFATPYYYMLDRDVEVVVASPNGGRPPIDPKSENEAYQTEATQRFYSDEDAQAVFGNTVRLSLVNHEDFDAVFYPGGHGPLWDLSQDRNSIELIEAFYESDKPIAFVCHAPAALKNVMGPNNQPLVSGKKVTGFTNGEEAAVQLTEVVPFLVEDMIRNLGGTYVSGDDWSSFAVEDGLLITGQNPQSSALVAEMLLKRLN